ncbi:MAG TPA: xanthine dehydrogenase family protein molybdopterin-binding subunit [Nonomuraea sp.]|nr:xanthine dehydrogenase family protein molybdopterin-binding subunit [Nonomuraea sp.]
MTGQLGVWAEAHRGTAQPEQPGMVDATDRVTGKADYVINMAVPGMLHAMVLRSTAPHARIVRIDTEQAKLVPGVVTVLTGADIAARKDVRSHYGPVLRDQPVLAIDRVRFVGEAVVAVAAVDRDAARAALDLVEVEYEELAAVFTIDDALAEGAPLVHPEPPRAGATFADIIVHTQAGSNVCNSFKLRKGNIDEGFAQSDYIFEDTFTAPAVQHVPLETHCTVADARTDDIVIHTTSQIPFMVRSQLAEVFNLPSSRVRVVVHSLGGGYGGKCYPNTEPLTAMLSRFSGRPVKLHLTREEEFTAITRHGMQITLKTGLTRDGKVIARKSTCHFNTGAFADIGPRLIKMGGIGTGGPTSIPNVWIDSAAIYTNLPPAGAYRGYGISQAAWAYETQIEMIAQRLGWDPYQLRKKNLLVNGETNATGEVMDDSHWHELLDQVAGKIGWSWPQVPERVGNKVRAKGLSCIIKGTVTPSASTSMVKMNDDGSLNVMTSSVEMGQGLQTSMAILAAERLSMSVSKVTVSTPDTAFTPYDQQTSSSRSTHSMGMAVTRACGGIADQLIAQASEALEIAPGDLELRDGMVRAKGAPDTAIDYATLVKGQKGGNLLATGEYITGGGLDPETGQGIAAVHWHQAAGAAEVEVDLETGKVRVLAYEAAVYAGRVVNPVQAELQAEGNVAFGVGHALFEEMVYDNGQLQNGNLGDYMICSFEDMPEHIGVNNLEEPVLNEIHGIGETGLPPVMPAIGNAVFHATGVRITDVPITPEKVLRGLRALAAERDAAVAKAAATTGPAR